MQIAIEPDTVTAAVIGLRKFEAIAVFPLTREKLRELSALLDSHRMEDIDFAAFEYTPQGPTLALWRRGTRTVQEIAAHIGAYSIN